MVVNGYVYNKISVVMTLIFSKKCFRPLYNLLLSMEKALGIHDESPQ